MTSGPKNGSWTWLNINALNLKCELIYTVNMSEQVESEESRLPLIARGAL